MCTLGILNIGNLFDYGTCIIGKGIIPLLFALALVMFVWGAVNYFIISAGEEAKRTKGKQFMIWGILAFVVMSSVWALVNILDGTFKLNTRVIPGIAPRDNPFIKTQKPKAGGQWEVDIKEDVTPTFPIPPPTSSGECTEDYECGNYQQCVKNTGETYGVCQ